MGQNKQDWKVYNYSCLYLSHLKINLLPIVSIQRNVETKMVFAASVSPRLLFCLPINSLIVSQKAEEWYFLRRAQRAGTQWKGEAGKGCLVKRELIWREGRRLVSCIRRKMIVKLGLKESTQLGALISHIVCGQIPRNQYIRI